VWRTAARKSLLGSQPWQRKVSATLVEALNVDEDEIKPTATLQGDLGAESINSLDIVFRLEREPANLRTEQPVSAFRFSRCWKRQSGCPPGGHPATVRS
jgi:hypothetical protein